MLGLVGSSRASSAVGRSAKLVTWARIALSVVPAARPQAELVALRRQETLAPRTPVLEKLFDTQTVAAPPEKRPKPPVTRKPLTPTAPKLAS